MAGVSGIFCPGGASRLSAWGADVSPTDVTPTMSDVSPTNRPVRGICERSRQLRVT